jgi:hypothetical protein
MGDIKTVIGLIAIPIAAGIFTIHYLLPAVQRFMEGLL